MGRLCRSPPFLDPMVGPHRIMYVVCMYGYRLKNVLKNLGALTSPSSIVTVKKKKKAKIKQAIFMLKTRKHSRFENVGIAQSSIEPIYSNRWSHVPPFILRTIVVEPSCLHRSDTSETQHEEVSDEHFLPSFFLSPFFFPSLFLISQSMSLPIHTGIYYCVLAVLPLSE